MHIINKSFIVNYNFKYIGLHMTWHLEMRQHFPFSLNSFKSAIQWKELYW